MPASLAVAVNVPAELIALAHDPQTSGGLLAAVPPGDLNAVEADLAVAGVPSRRVGSVESGQGVSLS